MKKVLLLAALALGFCLRADAQCGPGQVPIAGNRGCRNTGAVVVKGVDGSVAIRTTLLPEYNLGTCTTAATVDPANGNRQKITLTAAQTCVLTFTQPVGSTASIQLTVIQSSAGAFNGAISGGLWPGGTVPTITATSGAVDVITCFLSGTDAKCVATQDFR